MHHSTSPLPSLFDGLSDVDRDDFLASGALRELPARALLYRQGEAACSLFMIRSGRVALTCTSAKGRHVVLRMVGAEGSVGIASLTAGSYEVATAMTLELTSVLVWDANTCRTAGIYPALVHNAFRITLQYLKEYGDRHVALLSHSAEQRLANALVRLGATSGRVVPTGVEIEISNEDLAALSDVGLFTTSRQLKRWERNGHLVKRRHRVLICDPNGLMPECRPANRGGCHPTRRRSKKS